MNKKGFAISVILYAVIFVVIAIFYLLLSIIKSRYSVNSDLKNDIMLDLNSGKHMYTKLNNDNPASVLIVDPDGGSVDIDGLTVTEVTRVVKYANENTELKNAVKDNAESIEDSYTVTYNANGGNATPASQTVNNINTKSYSFEQWSDTGNCGVFANDTYTFPIEYGDVCTKKANWGESNNVTFDAQIELAPPISKTDSYFIGWKSSLDNQIYSGGSEYFLAQNVVMTAQWIDEVWAEELIYDDKLNNMMCEDVQCALDKVGALLEGARTRKSN